MFLGLLTCGARSRSLSNERHEAQDESEDEPKGGSEQVIRRRVHAAASSFGVSESFNAAKCEYTV